MKKEATATEPVKKRVFPKTWKPVRMMDIPEDMKENGMVYFFRTTNKDGNITRRLAEGEELDELIMPKMRERGLVPKTINDGKEQDNIYRIREMVLTKMPIELAKQRKEYYNNRTDEQDSRVEEDLKSTTPIYGKIQRSVSN